MTWRIRNRVSGLLVPGVYFEWRDQAEAWIAEQLRPQDFEPFLNVDAELTR